MVWTYVQFSVLYTFKLTSHSVLEVANSSRCVLNQFPNSISGFHGYNVTQLTPSLPPNSVTTFSCFFLLFGALLRQKSTPYVKIKLVLQSVVF